MSRIVSYAKTFERRTTLARLRRRPRQWHLRGMLGTLRASNHRLDLRNVFYRSIASFGFVAKAFGDEKLFGSIRQYMREFEAAAGEGFA